MTRSVVACLLFLCASCTVTRAAAPVPFELRDGDRVVFIGNTFIEREQTYSYLETLLHLQWPDRKITFRNLGWSGDTVFGESRAIYDGVKGLDRLVALVHELKPTVIFICYGEVESYGGESGVEHFRQGLNQLLDKLDDLHARTVLIGPTKHEEEAASHNAVLGLYRDVVRDAASGRKILFVDMFDVTGEGLTENGVHLSEDGYRHAAQAIAQQLGINDKRANERVRALSIQKNIQFFNQYRPANEPYIFGFRKAEQSRNRVELPWFTQSIEWLEKQINEELKSK